MDYTSQALSRRLPLAPSKYPTIMNAQSGHGATVQRDAIGRALVSNQERDTAADRFGPNSSGLPNPKPAAYQDAIMRALGSGMDNSRYSVPSIRSQDYQGMQPNAVQSPGGMGGLTPQEYQRFMPETGGVRPNSTRLQALAATRAGKMGGMNVGGR